MSLRWRAVGSAESDLTGPRFEPQTLSSRDESVTARPTQQSWQLHFIFSKGVFKVSFTAQLKAPKWKASA